MRQKNVPLTPEEKRRSWRLAIILVAGMAALLLAALSLRNWTAPAVVPETDARVLEAALGLDTIAVDVVFDPDSLHQLTATQTLTLINRTGQAQSAAILRSYTGAYLLEETSPAAVDELFADCYGVDFSTGGLLVDEARANGEKVAYAWQDTARTVLSLPLATPWEPGETLTIDLTWHAAVPACASRFGVSEGIWTLGNLFPTPAVWEDGAYRTDPYSAIGDPFLTDCASWQVTLTVPSRFTAAATAYAVPETKGDVSVYRWSAPAVRDFTVVLSDTWQVFSRMEGDTAIFAYAATVSGAKAMGQAAAQALRCFEAHYGDYVYPTLTLCEVDFPFAGMEYPCLVMIGRDAVARGGETLSSAVAHETAHQWWAIQVGSDGWYQSWQDESLATYAQMDYLGDTLGQAAREEAIQRDIETALRVTVPRGITPGSPIDYFSDLSEYTLVVYNRGAAMWVALERLMGKDTLDAALRAYQEEYRFRRATRQQLTDILSRYAGMDVSALMSDYLDTMI